MIEDIGTIIALVGLCVAYYCNMRRTDALQREVDELKIRVTKLLSK